MRTSNPEYYKWTQWIFIQLFDAWYDHSSGKSRHIDSLIQYLNEHGTKGLQAAETEALALTAEQWKGLNEKDKSEVLLNYRLAYRSESNVNWCPALGTVLANDEVKDGVSERGGHPVIHE